MTGVATAWSLPGWLRLRLSIPLHCRYTAASAGKKAISRDGGSFVIASCAGSQRAATSNSLLRRSRSSCRSLPRHPNGSMRRYSADSGSTQFSTMPCCSTDGFCRQFSRCVAGTVDMDVVHKPAQDVDRVHPHGMEPYLEHFVHRLGLDVDMLGRPGRSCRRYCCIRLPCSMPGFPSSIPVRVASLRLSAGPHQVSGQSPTRSCLRSCLPHTTGSSPGLLHSRSGSDPR